MSELQDGAPANKRPMLARAAWRHYQALVSCREIESNFHVGLVASFTVNSLIPYLGAHMVEAGMKPAFQIGPYNQIFQVCLNPEGYFGVDCDAILILWRLEDLMEKEILSFLQGDASAIRRAADKIDLLGSALASLRSSFKGTLLITIPPYPATMPVDSRSLMNPNGMGHFHRIIVSAFLNKVSEIKKIVVCDLDALQRDFGASAAFDSRQWYLYRQPFNDFFLSEMGVLIGRVLMARTQAPKKCVILDCDNTLWGGVIGEDGIDGIQIGEDFPGSAYRDFQRLLLYWRGQGILLALGSKNNEGDVWEVFEKHRGMVLKREHISTWQINWNPKAENIPLIARALNIGTDSLVFIDDNPIEIDYMRSARPEVISILLPEDPADILKTMRELFHFDRLEITQEDLQRADMIQAERQREALGGSLSKQDFFKTLDLHIDLFRAESKDLDRIAQLINKTNQFNLTTIRRSLDEVTFLAGSSRHRIFGLRVSDKFGDYGLTGVIIVEIHQDTSVWYLDTLLLSCRVLGRGVETALLSFLAEHAEAEGVTTFIGSFIPTAKNAVIASYLSDHGFRKRENGQWHLLLAEMPASILAIRSVSGTSLTDL